ncbi:MAG: 2-isopropylmalate synthase [Clostridia bacterium]|nr:2-isopropylmalate synthase [Clostridia bacterium]
MIQLDTKRNTLMQKVYHYQLQDVAEPNLYREIFPYVELPKIPFTHRESPMDPPEDIWITDSTFRDGQQAREPYTAEQVVRLYDLLHELGGPKGIIRQTEFFLYSKLDRDCAYKCMERGYSFPEVTGWIRATEKDFDLAKSMEVKECGILVSASDYHIFHKLGKTRKEAMRDYLKIIESAIAAGIRPRCHMEDITRADFYGFVVPFAHALHQLMEDTGVPIKIRTCDTMGYGVSYPGADLPRSVPGIMYGLRYYAGFSSALLEWHGHNDFYKAVTNAASAWLYGASSVNCTLLGIGERTGNTPVEGMVAEYAQLRGTLDGMNPQVITEIADYYRTELKYDIPPQTPLVGRDFNATQAGIHADGLMKDQEIYNAFDTKLILNVPPKVIINAKSGLAGVAYWLNNHPELINLPAPVDKKNPVVLKIKEWVDEQFAAGRVAAISDAEMAWAYKKFSN